MFGNYKTGAGFNTEVIRVDQSTATKSLPLMSISGYRYLALAGARLLTRSLINDDESRCAFCKTRT